MRCSGFKWCLRVMKIYLSAMDPTPNVIDELKVLTKGDLCDLLTDAFRTLATAGCPTDTYEKIDLTLYKDLDADKINNFLDEWMNAVNERNDKYYCNADFNSKSESIDCWFSEIDNMYLDYEWNVDNDEKDEPLSVI